MSISVFYFYFSIVWIKNSEKIWHTFQHDITSKTNFFRLVDEKFKFKKNWKMFEWMFFTKNIWVLSSKNYGKLIIPCWIRYIVLRFFLRWSNFCISQYVWDFLHWSSFFNINLTIFKYFCHTLKRMWIITFFQIISGYNL